MMSRLQRRRRQGRALRQLLDSYFASYSDFARFMAVSPSAVSHWMNGRTPIPGNVLESLARICPDEVDMKLFGA